MQLLAAIFATMLCAALAATPGLAQQATDRSGEGVGGDTATKGEAHFNGVNPGGDHASANRSRAGDATHIGVSAHEGVGLEASRAASAGAPAMTVPRADAAANSDLGPIRLEGFSGLQRRANRNAFFANAPKIPGRPPAAIGISVPFTFSGANGATAHNPASIVARSASSPAPGTASLERNTPDVRTAAPMGVNGVGSTASSVTAAGTAAAWRRPSLPSSAVAGPPSHAGVISGTTVSHTASGPGYLGGPAKDRSGINGTALRPKY